MFFKKVDRFLELSLSQATKISGEVNGEELLKEIQQLHTKIDETREKQDTNQREPQLDDSKILELEEKITKMAKEMEETKMKYSIEKPVEPIFTEPYETEGESESPEQAEFQEEPTLEKLNDEIRKLRKNLLSEQQSSTSKISVLNESLGKIKTDNSEKEQHLVALKEQITKDQSKIMREIQAKV